MFLQILLDWQNYNVLSCYKIRFSLYLFFLIWRAWSPGVKKQLCKPLY